MSTEQSDGKNWVKVQERTFLRWINMKLEQGKYPTITRLDNLSSGISLCQLLNVLTNQELVPIYSKPSTKFQRMENMEKILDFIKDRERLHIYNIGPEDIVDSNLKLTLGLLWTLILKYSMVENDNTAQNEGELGGRSKKEILLRWAQLVTKDYDDIEIKNFTTSWSDGHALAAILSHFEPELLDYQAAIREEDDHQLAETIMKKAESVGIHRLIDVDDLVCSKPDEKSVIAYVSVWYENFHVREILKIQQDNLDRLRGTRNLVNDEVENKKDDSIPAKQLRVRMETFIAVVGNLVSMKNKLLVNMESLIIEMANWMAQLSFSENEFHNTEDVLRFRQTLMNYRTSGKMKIFKDMNSLRTEKIKLNMCLRDYNFERFEEPPEKSLEKAQRLLKQLRVFETEAQHYVSKYLDKKIEELTTNFHRNASSIQHGLNLIEGELAEDQMSTKDQLNSLAEIMDDLKSLDMMTSRLDGILKEIDSLFSRLGKVYDHFDADIKVSKFKVKAEFLRELVVERLKFIDREFQNKDKVFRILKASMTEKDNGKDEKENVKKDNSPVVTTVNGVDSNAANLDGLALEKYVFDKFDRGNKDYLNKSEFNEAFGYLYPRLSDSQLGELFEIIYNSSHEILRGVRFEDFAKLLRSTSEDGELDSNADYSSLKKKNKDSSKQLPNIPDEVLADMKGEFYLKAFKETSNSRDFITVGDLEKLEVDHRLIERVGDILTELESDKVPTADKSYDYIQFFDKPDSSQLYQDVSRKPGDTEEKDANIKGLDNILQDLNEFDLRSM
ncbi:DEKNAAC102766 [Brettanomyces naardenensis]|uniref:DEKNAAC102766 n=1 Tax=Brettanomyces naardenensis TaxID=13370 RepID=A0A448YKZ6_BRENA|nr:DEKNAAC102766 [Brettanomyces naardenensis]